MHLLVITLTILRSIPLISYEHRNRMLTGIFATLTGFDTKGLDRPCPPASGRRISGALVWAPIWQKNTWVLRVGSTSCPYSVHSSRMQDMSESSPESRIRRTRDDSLLSIGITYAITFVINETEKNKIPERLYRAKQSCATNLEIFTKRIVGTYRMFLLSYRHWLQIEPDQIMSENCRVWRLRKLQPLHLKANESVSKRDCMLWYARHLAAPLIVGFPNEWRNLLIRFGCQWSNCYDYIAWIFCVCSALARLCNTELFMSIVRVTELSIFLRLHAH